MDPESDPAQHDPRLGMTHTWMRTALQPWGRSRWTESPHLPVHALGAARLIAARVRELRPRARGQTGPRTIPAIERHLLPPRGLAQFSEYVYTGRNSRQTEVGTWQ